MAIWVTIPMPRPKKTKTPRAELQYPEKEIRSTVTAGIVADQAVTLAMVRCLSCHQPLLRSDGHAIYLRPPRGIDKIRQFTRAGWLCPRCYEIHMEMMYPKSK